MTHGDALRGLELRSLMTSDGRLEVSLQEVDVPEPAHDQVVVRMEGAPIHPSDIGLLLGRLKQPTGDGPRLFASWEDTLLVFFGPRGGKTTSLGVPYVLSAPGPVVATSVKADLWAVTVELRGASWGAVGFAIGAELEGPSGFTVERRDETVGVNLAERLTR